MATTLYEAKVFTPANAWRKARMAIDVGRPRAARLAVLLVNPAAAKSLDDVLDSPARYLARGATAIGRANAELTTLALMRMASNDPDAAAGLLGDRWERLLPADLSAWTWGVIGKQAAQKLQPNAADYFLRASTLAARANRHRMAGRDAWLEGARRTARRQRPPTLAAGRAGRQRDERYGAARAGLAVLEGARPAGAAKDSQDPESLRALSRELLDGLIGQLNFYGALSAEDAALPFGLPAPPAPLTPARDRRRRRRIPVSRAHCS
jgi:soluble lytic murein transglycosylase